MDTEKRGGSCMEMEAKKCPRSPEEAGNNSLLKNLWRKCGPAAALISDAWLPEL